MRIDLSGRHAVVTGSTAGIRLASAKALAEAGAVVTVNGRGAERVAAAAAAVRAHVPGADVRGVAADLATTDGCASFVAQAPAADILVNNLAVVKPTPFDAITDDDWQRYFDTNVMSGIRLSRAYFPGMVASG